MGFYTPTTKKPIFVQIGGTKKELLKDEKNVPYFYSRSKDEQKEIKHGSAISGKFVSCKYRVTNSEEFGEGLNGVITLEDGGDTYILDTPMYSTLRKIFNKLATQTQLGTIQIELYNVKGDDGNRYPGTAVYNNGEKITDQRKSSDQGKEQGLITEYTNLRTKKVEPVYTEFDMTLIDIVSKIPVVDTYIAPVAIAIDPAVPTGSYSVETTIAPAQEDDRVQTPAETEAMLQQHQADVEVRAKATSKPPRALKDAELPSEAQIYRASKTWKDKVNAMTNKDYKIDDYCLETYGYVFMELSKGEMTKFIDLLLNTKSTELESILKRSLHNPDDDQDFDPDKITPPKQAQPVIEEDFSDLPF